jgi:hypothetical protein
MYCVLNKKKIKFMSREKIKIIQHTGMYCVLNKKKIKFMSREKIKIIQHTRCIK